MGADVTENAVVPQLSVIIVSWNVRGLLEKCLASLERAEKAGDAPRLEIIVVDCASADGSATMVSRRFPNVTLLEQSENVGFTRGSNLGLSRATADTLLLLNPDTEIIGGALNLMLDFLRGNPAVGIVGPHTLNSDSSHQSTRRRFPTLATGFFESSWLSRFAPDDIVRRYEMRDTDDDAIVEVDWAQGSALMLRRAVYADIGGMDEGFVMYSEELDYCRRAKAAGWKVFYLGAARITHHGGKSSEQASAFAQLHFHRSKLRYFRKHHGAAQYRLLRASVVLQFWWQMALECGKLLLRHKPELRRQRLRIYLDVLRAGIKAEV